MGDPGTARLQEELRSPNATAAWEAFLAEYSPPLYQAARACTDKPDDAADCFLFICENLARNGYRRLLKFNPEGSASFLTWLRVVARNLCFDWHRTQAGRYRPLRMLERRSELEIEVYNCRIESGLSEEATLQRLRQRFPGISASQVLEAETRLENSMTSRQRWILSTRRKFTLPARAVLLSDEGEEIAWDVPDPHVDPERSLAEHQQRVLLEKHVALLPDDERLLLQLRFEQELTLEEIAGLTALGDAQRVHRRIGSILKKLRSVMK